MQDLQYFLYTVNQIQHRTNLFMYLFSEIDCEIMFQLLV